MLSWETVESDARYQALPQRQKDAVKYGYWKDYVEPSKEFDVLTPDARRGARDEFLGGIPSQPEIGTDTTPDPSFFKRLIGGGALSPQDKAEAVVQLTPESSPSVRMPIGGVGDALQAGQDAAKQFHWKGAIGQAGYDIAKFPSDVVQGAGQIAAKVEGRDMGSHHTPTMQERFARKEAESKGLPFDEQAFRQEERASRQDKAKALISFGKTGTDYYKKKAEDNPEIQAFKKAVSEDKESIWTQAVGAAGSLGGAVGTSIIPGVGPLAAGAGFFNLNKEEAYEQAKEKLTKAGADPETAEKRAERVSWTAGTINSVLDTVGVGRIAHVFKPARKLMNFFTGALVTSQIEGGTEAVQSIVTKVSSEYAAKPKDESQEEFVSRMADNLPKYAKEAKADYLIGSILGGGAHVVGGGIPTAVDILKDREKKTVKPPKDKSMEGLSKVLQNKDIPREDLETLRKGVPDGSEAAVEIDKVLGQLPEKEGKAKKVEPDKPIDLTKEMIKEPIELTDVVSALPVKREEEVVYPKDITGPRIAGQLPAPKTVDWGPPKPGEAPAGQKALPEEQKKIAHPKPKALKPPSPDTGPESPKQFGKPKGKTHLPPGKPIAVKPSPAVEPAPEIKEPWERQGLKPAPPPKIIKGGEIIAQVYSKKLNSNFSLQKKGDKWGIFEATRVSNKGYQSFGRPLHELQATGLTEEQARKKWDEQFVPLGEAVAGKAQKPSTPPKASKPATIVEKVKWDPEKDKIAATALKLTNSKIVAGQVHADAYKQLTDTEKEEGFTEGFVTQSGKFVTSKQAKDVFGTSEINAIDDLQFPIPLEEQPQPIITKFRQLLTDLKKEQGEKAYFDKRLKEPRKNEPQEVLNTYRKLHPKGVAVLYKEDKDQGAMISPSSKEPGRWQVTWFDERGFIGDASHKTEVDAFKEAYQDGYRVPDPVRGEKQMSSKQFLQGVIDSERVQQEHMKAMAKSAEKRKAPPSKPLTKDVDKIKGTKIVGQISDTPKLIELRTPKAGKPFQTEKSARFFLKTTKKGSEFDYDLIKVDKGYIWREKAEKPTATQKLILEDEKANDRRRVLARESKDIRTAIMHSGRLKRSDKSFKGEFRDVLKGPGAWPLSMFRKDGLAVDEMASAMIEAGWLPKGATEQDLMEAIEQNIKHKVSGGNEQELIDKYEEEEYNRHIEGLKADGFSEEEIRKADGAGISKADEDVGGAIESLESEEDPDQDAIDELDDLWFQDQQSLFAPPEEPLLKPVELTKTERLARAQDKAKKEGITKKGAKPIFQSGKGIKVANVGKQQGLFGPDAGQQDLFTNDQNQIEIKFKKADPLQAKQSIGMSDTAGSVSAAGWHVRNMDEAASLLSKFKDAAQENLFIISVDKDNKVLEVHRYSKGSINRSVAVPTELAGHVLNVPGAHTAYSVHNHPGGETTPSGLQGDQGSIKAFENILKLKGIKSKSLILGDGAWRGYDSTDIGAVTPIKELPGSVTIPLQERIITKRSKGKNALGSSKAASIIEKEYQSKEGFLLLDNKMKDLGFLPFIPGRESKETTIDVIKAAESTGALGVVFNSKKPITGYRRDYLRNFAIRLHPYGIQLMDILDVGGFSHRDIGLLAYSGDGSIIKFAGRAVSRQERADGKLYEIGSSKTLLSKGIAKNREADPQPLQELRGDVLGWLKDVLPKSALKRLTVELTPEITRTGKDTTESDKQHSEIGKGTGEVLGASTTDPLRSFIEISYNYDNDTIQRSVYHESWHVVTRWLLGDTDYNAMTKLFDGNEEAAADAFMNWAKKAKGQPLHPGAIYKIFKQIKQALEAIRNGLKGKGFKSSEAVFEKVWNKELDLLPGGKRVDRWAKEKTQHATYADPFFSKLIRTVEQNLKQMPAKAQSLMKWLQKKGDKKSLF